MQLQTAKASIPVRVPQTAYIIVEPRTGRVWTGHHFSFEHWRAWKFEWRSLAGLTGQREDLGVLGTAWAIEMVQG